MILLTLIGKNDKNPKEYVLEIEFEVSVLNDFCLAE